MTDLNDLAEAENDTEIVLARESHGLYRLEGTDVADADEISPEGEFPKYGRYIAATKLDRGGTEKGRVLLEVPRGLARSLTDAELDETGACFWIRNVAKDTENRWVFDVEPAEDAPGWDGPAEATADD